MRNQQRYIFTCIQLDDQQRMTLMKIDIIWWTNVKTRQNNIEENVNNLKLQKINYSIPNELIIFNIQEILKSIDQLFYNLYSNIYNYM